MVRTALFLSLAIPTSAPASAVVLMGSAPVAPVASPVPPAGASGGPHGHVVIEDFENTLKDDMNFASYNPAPAAAAQAIAAPNVAAVPEPATWATMLGGFAMAGATLRRRKSGTTAPLSR
jgi:hypothetical protein